MEPHGPHIPDVPDVPDVPDIPDIPRSPRVLSISCDACVMARTAACDDCIVTFVVNREPGDALVVDADAARDLRLLSRGGLVPRLRHRSRASPAHDRPRAPTGGRGRR